MILPLLMLAAAAAPTYSPETDRQLVRSIYEELVCSKTGYTTGETTQAAEAMAKRLLDAGFPKEDVVVLGAAPHKGNLVARYRGTGKARPLLLLAHLDVVEAQVARTGASIPSRSSRRTATSTAAAPATTRRRRRSGWRTFLRCAARAIGRRAT